MEVNEGVFGKLEWLHDWSIKMKKPENFLRLYEQTLLN
jgi:hypothetical protein